MNGETFYMILRHLLKPFSGTQKVLKENQNRFNNKYL